jgi:hypothetical protein
MRVLDEPSRMHHPAHPRTHPSMSRRWTPCRVPPPSFRCISAAACRARWRPIRRLTPGVPLTNGMATGAVPGSQQHREDGLVAAWERAPVWHLPPEPSQKTSRHEEAALGQHSSYHKGSEAPVAKTKT